MHASEAGIVGTYALALSSRADDQAEFRWKVIRLTFLLFAGSVTDDIVKREVLRPRGFLHPVNVLVVTPFLGHDTHIVFPAERRGVSPRRPVCAFVSWLNNISTVAESDRAQHSRDHPCCGGLPRASVTVDRPCAASTAKMKAISQARDT